MRQSFEGRLRVLCPPHTMRLDGHEGDPAKSCHDDVLSVVLFGCVEKPTRELLALKDGSDGDWVRVTIETHEQATAERVQP